MAHRRRLTVFCSRVMPTVRLTKSDVGRIILLQVGDDVILELDENPSTGYSWDLEAPGEATLRPLSTVFRSQPAVPPGAGGMRQFRFVATALGQTALTLKLWREWEGDPSIIKRFSITVEVRR